MVNPPVCVVMLSNRHYNCTLCPLHETCNGTVWGRGPEDAKLAIFAEAPGKDENIYKYPLIGPSGVMVVKMLECIGIDPDTVYYSNVVKCRPEGNETPIKPEIKTCTGYHLENELDKLPYLQWVWILGKTAYYGFHGRDCKITKDLGKEEVVTNLGKNNLRSLLLFHPSYLMRNAKLDPGTPKEKQWKVLVNWYLTYKHELLTT